MPEDKDLMTIKMVADMLILSEDTIKNYVKSRTIPHYKVLGSVRFSRTKILNWIKDGERK